MELEYVKVGCVKLPFSLNDKTTEILRNESKLLLQGKLQTCQAALKILEQDKWQDILFANDSGVIIRKDFLGQSPQLDQAIESVIKMPAVEEILLATLGSNYKLFLIQIRQATPFSDCLRIHQDRPGQTTLQILLDDVPTTAGSTVVISGSSNWPRIINSFPLIKPKYIMPYLKTLTGKKGDIWLFSPTMWHGRHRSNERSQTVLMMSFIPFNSQEILRIPPSNIIEKLGPRLASLLQERQFVLSLKLAATEELQRLLEANPQFKLWSPWQLAIIISNISLIFLSNWRFFKLFLMKIRDATCGKSLVE